MASQVITYQGDFGGQGAGTSGLDLTLTGSALPSNAVIDSIAYAINLTATKYSSSKKWCLHSFYLDSGSPSASYNEVYMSGTSGQISGYMNFSQSDVSVFDGSFTLHAKANNNMDGSNSFMRAVAISVEYHLSYNKSTATLTSSSVEAGKTSTVSFSGDDLSNLYQVVTWSIGSYSYKLTTATGATSASYTLPLEWVKAIPSSTSGSVTVYVETYSSDGQVGTQTLTQAMTVPSSVVPTLTSLTAENILGDVPSSWGVYVQGKSGVRLIANGAAGTYGSTISSYTFSGGTTATQTSNILSVQRIDQSGSVTFSVVAVDSRGRSSAAKSVTISIQPYSSPSVTQAIAERCTSGGTVSDEGTYISAKVNATYSSVSGKNSVSIQCYYQKNGDATWTNALNSMSLDTAYIIGGGNVSTSYTYSVKFIITDQLETVEKIVTVGTASYIVFYRTDGTGVGIGKVCEADHSFEINGDWAFKYGTVNVGTKLNSIPSIVYTTGSTPTGSAGMIWLKKK